MKIPRSPAYKSTYAAKKLRGLARSLEIQLEKAARGKNGVAPELVDRQLAVLEKLDEIDRQATLGELAGVREELRQLSTRVGSLEAKNAFR